MKRITLIAMGLLVVWSGALSSGCKRKPPAPDLGYHHSPEGIYQKINELRLQLTEALEKGQLQYIHDSMYYFKDLLTALSLKLEGEKKQRVDAILRDLTQIADAIDNSAGRGNRAATEANLKRLIQQLQDLENEVKSGK